MVYPLEPPSPGPPIWDPGLFLELIGFGRFYPDSLGFLMVLGAPLPPLFDYVTDVQQPINNELYYSIQTL